MRHKGDVWMRAASFAAKAHRSQLRKDGMTPYYAHVARVALTVSSVFRVHDEETLAIALLHDTIEDTTVDFDDVAAEFGETVARGVAALTKDMRLPEDDREAQYDAGLAKADWRVHLVKLADQYDNLSDMLLDDRGDKKIRKRVETCRRAIEIARGSRERPEVANAIAIVADLADHAERERLS
jgi:(p)ppGpp synthase/HD superfamily hydrolase